MCPTPGIGGVSGCNPGDVNTDTDTDTDRDTDTFTNTDTDTDTQEPNETKEPKVNGSLGRVGRARPRKHLE